MSTNEDKYKTLFESSRDAIMILTPPSWKFTSANPATIELFKVKTEKDFTVLGPWDVAPEKQPDGQLSVNKAKKMIMKAMKEGSSFFDWTHKKLDGQEFQAAVLLTRMEIDGKQFLQATVRDISEQKKIEEEFKNKVEELEKINKIMIGRELKMVELKEKIKKLEGKK